MKEAIGYEKIVSVSALMLVKKILKCNLDLVTLTYGFELLN